jgi:hypothetical protein
MFVYSALLGVFIYVLPPPPSNPTTCLVLISEPNGVRRARLSLFTSSVVRGWGLSVMATAEWEFFLSPIGRLGVKYAPRQCDNANNSVSNIWGLSNLDLPQLFNLIISQCSTASLSHCFTVPLSHCPLPYCSTVSLPHCLTVRCLTHPLPHCSSVSFPLHCLTAWLLHCRTAPLSYCLSAPLSHCPTASLLSSLIATLSHCPDVSKPHHFTALVSHCLDVPLPHCTLPHCPTNLLFYKSMPDCWLPLCSIFPLLLFISDPLSHRSRA